MPKSLSASAALKLSKLAFMKSSCWSSAWRVRRSGSKGDELGDSLGDVSAREKESRLSGTTHNSHTGVGDQALFDNTYLPSISSGFRT